MQSPGELSNDWNPVHGSQMMTSIYYLNDTTFRSFEMQNNWLYFLTLDHLQFMFASSQTGLISVPKATARALLSRQTPSPPPSDPFGTLTPTLRIAHGQSPYSSDHHICR